MAEPDTPVLTLLRELRREMNSRFDQVDRRFADMGGRLDEHDRKLGAIRQGLKGETILGRYAVAEVDDRLDAIERRLEALEERK